MNNGAIQISIKRIERRPKKTWLDMIRNSLLMYNLLEEITLNRAKEDMIHVVDSI